MSNRKSILIMSAILLCLAGIAVAMILSNRIETNPSDKHGNFSGNLYNRGLFCEDEGRVFFSNPYDGGKMYSMNSDETDIKKILDYNVEYINAAGKHIYYYQTPENDAVVMGFAGHTMGVYRCNKNGRRVMCLDRTPSGCLSLIGDYIYYQHFSNSNKEGMTLHKIKTDKTENVQVADYIIDPSCVYNGKMFFAATKDNHNLYMLDPATDTIETALEGSVWNPIIADGFIYYMKVSDDYKLYRYDAATGEDTKLTDDRVDTYNLNDSYIFYQSNGEDAALKRMNLNGDDVIVIRSGVHKNINITSNAVYFTQFDTDVPVYRVGVYNANLTEFSAARAAAEENMR